MAVLSRRKTREFEIPVSDPFSRENIAYSLKEMDS
jgi:hypothetical protein